MDNKEVEKLKERIKFLESKLEAVQLKIKNLKMLEKKISSLNMQLDELERLIAKINQKKDYKLREEIDNFSYRRMCYYDD